MDQKYMIERCKKFVKESFKQDNINAVLQNQDISPTSNMSMQILPMKKNNSKPPSNRSSGDKIKIFKRPKPHKNELKQQNIVQVCMPPDNE